MSVKFLRNISLVGMLFLALVLVACSAPGEPEVEVGVTREEAVTLAPTEVVEDPTADPTEVVVPEPTDLPATEVPEESGEEAVGIPQMGRIQTLDSVSFEVLAQYGGVASAVAVENGIAYVGFGPRLSVVDVSNPAVPVLMGQTEPLADIIHGIVIQDGFAFLASGKGGLVVVDVSDASSPVVVSDGPNYSGANQPSADTIQLDGDTAFVTDYNRTDSLVSLLVFDISNPAEPVLGSGYPLQINDNVVVNEGRLVIVGNGRIEVRETADSGTTAGEHPLVSGDYSSNVYIRDDMAFVVETGQQAGIEVFDISDLENPTLLNELAPVELFLGARVISNGSTLFSLGTFGEFGYCESQIDVIDISSLAFEKVSQLLPQVCVIDFVLDGSYLYTAGRSGLKVFDFSKPADVETVSVFGNPDGFHSTDALAVQGDMTYVLTGEGSGVEIRPVTLNGETAVQTGEPVVIGSTVVLDLFVQNGNLIAPQWQGGLYVYDISNAASPVEVYDPESGNIQTGDIFSVAFNGTIAYVPNVDGSQIGGVSAVDLSDPTNPTIASTFETGDYQLMHMVSGNGYLYVLAQGEAFHIHVYDISQPLAPKAVTVIDMPEPTNRLGLTGNTLVAVCDRWNCQSLYTIDVTDPSAPAFMGQWQIPVGAADLVEMGDGRFLLSTYEQGIWLLDISDVAAPVLSGQAQLPGYTARLKNVDGVVYAAAYEAGLYILQMN